MSNSTLTFDIVPSSTQNPLGIEFWVNDQCLLNQDQVVDTVHVNHEFDDEIEQQHSVKIVLKNKTAQHTQINEKLEIIGDSVVEVKNFRLDDIDIDQVVREQAVYSHSFNSSGEYTDHKFYNTLGCNGIVKFKFSTPSYLWLLEHM
jgi:hypothetical protein